MRQALEHRVELLAFPQYHQTFSWIGTLPWDPGPGRVDDPDLAAWLEALGHPSAFQLEENASAIGALHPVIVDDLMGGEIDVGHYTWVSAAEAIWDRNYGDFVPGDAFTPASVSGRFGCGRVMYTTYHTAPVPHAGLLPQELTMLSLILEISTCEAPTGVPPAG